jgi:SHS2 domain-containing protein
LLYRFHQQHAYFCDAEEMVVMPTQLNCRLVASVWAEAFHGDYQEVKAVTYHQLEVRCENSTCRATFILDI